MVESTECEVVAAILVDVNSPFCLSLFAFHLRKFLANPSNSLEIVLILRTYEVVEDHACSVVGTCSTVKLDYIRLTLLEFEFWRDQPVASCRTCVRTHECRWLTSEVRSVELPCLARNIAVVESRPCSELVGRIKCDIVWQSCCLRPFTATTDGNLWSLISLSDIEIAESYHLVGSCSCGSEECQIIVTALSNGKHVVFSSSSIVDCLHLEVCNLLECACIRL